MKKGTITSVHKDTDKNEVRVTVQADIGQEYRKIQFTSPAPGFYYIPKVGQQVILYDEGGGTRAAMHPKAVSQSPPALPDISEGEYGIVTVDGASVIIKNDGSVVVDGDDVTIGNGGQVQADGSTVTLGAGGTNIIKDVVAETTTDADGHVTSVSLNITRSSVTETE